MTKREITLAREYVDRWFECLNGDMAIDSRADRLMANLRISLPDVLFVIETGAIVATSKEEPNNALFTIRGPTIDDEMIEVQFDLDPLKFGFRLISVSKILEQDNEQLRS